MESIQSAQLVLPGSPFDETIAFFRDRLGFRVDIISPADDPSVVTISGYGLTIRLERNIDQSTQSPATIHLLLQDPSDGCTELMAPNGTKIQLRKATEKLLIPSLEPSFVMSRMSSDAVWVKGRAGMNYRDLIPNRQGGRFIASHIQIPQGGPVNDHVHYHQIRFQMIYVYKGWVRLVYEDQGEPFVLHAGDCVLQPPLIRHRVLESSSGLEVIEVACPAVHDTYIDHQMNLPTNKHLPERDFQGQRFLKYIRAEEKTAWQPWRTPGFEYQDTGIGLATAGLAAVKVIRRHREIQSQKCQHQAELVFIFVLTGRLSMNVNEQLIENLTDGDAFVLPENLPYTFLDCSHDLQLLEVSLPGSFPTNFQQ